MTIFDDLRAGVRTSSALETEALGQRLATALPDNVLLALYGDLGSGKTTLVRGIARGLGIDQPVTSPTYAIFSLHQGRRQLLHMDAYRLSGDADLEALALEDFLRPPFLIALEWPDIVPALLHDFPVYALSLRLLPDQSHLLQLVREG